VGCGESLIFSAPYKEEVRENGSRERVDCRKKVLKTVTS